MRYRSMIAHIFLRRNIMNNLQEKKKKDVLKKRIQVARGRIEKLKRILSNKFGIKLDRMKKMLNQLEQSINYSSKETLYIYEMWLKKIETDIDRLFEMIEAIISELNKTLQFKPPKPSRKGGR
jgi:hypothetical protein